VHATLRSIKTKPGQARTVADLIRSEYLPMLDEIDGFVSYILVDGGDDTVSSVGVFTEVDAAEEANARAKAWTAEKLMPYVDSPLSAAAGAVVISYPG
jgi:hypothetical protein